MTNKNSTEIKLTFFSNKADFYSLVKELKQDVYFSKKSLYQIAQHIENTELISREG